MQSHREHVEEFLRGGPRTQAEIQRAHIAALLAIEDALQGILTALQKEMTLLEREVDQDMPK